MMPLMIGSTELLLIAAIPVTPVTADMYPIRRV